VRWEDVVMDLRTGLQRAAQAGARVTGVDLTPEMRAVARRRAEGAGVGVPGRTGVPFPAEYLVVLGRKAVAVR
jgi:SAM-dependent methyltransferase